MEQTIKSDIVRSIACDRRSIRRGIVMVLLAASATVSGCKFRVPSPDEQSELVKQKTFPGGAPAWFDSSTSEVGTPRQASGYISPTLRGPNAIAPRVDEIEIPKTNITAQYEQYKASQAKTPTDLNSPLDRISKLCPSIEAEVNSALTNTDREARIAKYETLSARCPASADILLWLAADYRRAGRSMDARNTYEKVLVLDSANSEAQSGIGELNKELTAQDAVAAPTN